MYFLRRLRPLEVAGARVRSLRLSLNAPVLSAADLPIGPARALIVVHRDARGRMDATVGVRSQRGGELAYWSFDGELASDVDLDVASDAALTFAESLGFLFDEAPQPGGAAAEKVFLAWLEGQSLGEASDVGGQGTFTARPTAALRNDAGSELILDELAIEDAPPSAPVSTELPASQPSTRRAPAPSPPPRRPPLYKGAA